VTVGRVITARQLDMCGNHGELFGSFKQAFHAESFSVKTVILLVQEVSVSKLGLQIGGCKEKTQLVSNKSPED
jgi:hypothetical protein